jgi:hypothetical protein
VIYKCGDDVRQDQLVIQLITLMDRLLKRENIDLRLTPYRVLATSPDTGARPPPPAGNGLTAAQGWWSVYRTRTPCSS